MRNRILTLIILFFILTIAVNVYAVGQKGGSGSGNGSGIQNQEQTQTANQGQEIQVQTRNQEEIQSGTGTGNQVQNKNQEQVQQQQKQGQTNAEKRRNPVPNFIQTLKEIADREGGIGQQLRVIAQQQNQSAATTGQAMEKIQNRSKIKTFLIGSDYKNLGTLRSEIVQTRNRLEQLKRLMENVQNEGDKTELQNQIQALEQEQTRIENFIRAQEGKFSLFGWLAKLLAGY